MKRFLFVLAVLAILVGAAAAAASASGPTVELLSTSSSVSTADLQAALPAFQQAVTDELGPVWNVDAQLVVGDAANPTPSDMTIVVSDTPDCFLCGGYHWITANGQPFAKVFYFEDESWQLILTHELFEMLVDPYGNRFSRGGGKTWIVEVSDAVESGYYAHFIDGVAISDFITPAWYGGLPGRYDFGGWLKRPEQVGKHGYSSYLKPDGKWGQIFGWHADRWETTPHGRG